MTTFEVFYIAYERNSSFIINEGSMIVQSSQQFQAENVVKSMFGGANVVIRYTKQK